ncbi:MAG: dTMP kinase [Clostridiales bacterium]|jgi:dTMP kinase|nr:dTMP kinase [Clostridiales bacterium]
MYRGLFISFEGLDGSGKTTQVKMLYDYLIEKNIPAIMLREPGGAFVSEKIRSIIMENDISPYTEALLYAAARAELVGSVIKPSLLAKKIVVCDRFIDSSVAYQGYARGLGAENILNINKFGIGGLLPDITFFMDITPEASLKRRENATGLDRIESEGLAFHEKVYSGYKDLFLKFPGRIHRIDALGETVKIHNEIICFIEKQLFKD